MTAFLNNIIIFFPPSSRQHNGGGGSSVSKCDVSLFRRREGAERKGDMKTEVIVPSVLFVGFLILSCRPYCVHTVSPLSPSCDHQPRVTLGVTATLCPQRKSRTPIMFYVSYRRII